MPAAVFPLYVGALFVCSPLTRWPSPHVSTLRPSILRRLAGTLDAELAQRAVEYRGLAARHDVARAAVQPLPKWEKRTSLLLRRLAEKEVRQTGRRVTSESLESTTAGALFFCCGHKNWLLWCLGASNSPMCFGGGRSPTCRARMPMKQGSGPPGWLARRAQRKGQPLLLPLVHPQLACHLQQGRRRAQPLRRQRRPTEGRQTCWTCWVSCYAARHALQQAAACKPGFHGNVASKLYYTRIGPVLCLRCFQCAIRRPERHPHQNGERCRLPHGGWCGCGWRGGSGCSSRGGSSSCTSQCDGFAVCTGRLAPGNSPSWSGSSQPIRLSKGSCTGAHTRRCTCCSVACPSSCCRHACGSCASGHACCCSPCSGSGSSRSIWCRHVCCCRLRWAGPHPAHWRCGCLVPQAVRLHQRHPVGGPVSAGRVLLPCWWGLAVVSRAWCGGTAQQCWWCCHCRGVFGAGGC